MRPCPQSVTMAPERGTPGRMRNVLSSKTPRSRVRLYAAAWTAAVAAIPAYISAGTGDIAGEWIVPERIPLTLLAILAAGISGYWIGWRLIDPKGDHDSLGALFLGAVICLLSYYLLGVMVGLLQLATRWESYFVGYLNHGFGQPHLYHHDSVYQCPKWVMGNVNDGRYGSIARPMNGVTINQRQTVLHHVGHIAI